MCQKSSRQNTRHRPRACVRGCPFYGVFLRETQGAPKCPKASAQSQKWLKSLGARGQSLAARGARAAPRGSSAPSPPPRQPAPRRGLASQQGAWAALSSAAAAAPAPPGAPRRRRGLAGQRGARAAPSGRAPRGPPLLASRAALGGGGGLKQRG